MSGYEGEGTSLSGGFGDSNAGSGWGGSVGKPGESAMAQAESQQDRTGDSMGDVQGLNPENPSQSYSEMQNSQKVGDFLGVAAPAFMSTMAPGFGLMSGATKTAANVLGGMPIGQAVAGYAGGFINGKLNEATGGLYGKANMASGVARSLGVDMPSLNVGGALASAAFGGKSFGSAAPATAATSASDFVAQGVDSGGWRKRTGDTT